MRSQRNMRVAILGPIAWRVPPRDYGGWELVACNHAEGLARLGVDVTLFAARDAQTSTRLAGVVPRALSEDPSLPPRAWETLHAAACFEHAGEFDVIHNHAGAYAVCFKRLVNIPVVTTLHGSAAEADSRLIYERYAEGPYVSVSDAERALAPTLHYAGTVYNGIDVHAFSFRPQPNRYLLFLGRLSPVKGVHLAIEVARRTELPLIIAGIVPPEDQTYFQSAIAPHLDGDRVRFVGPADQARKNALLGGALSLLHLIQYHEAFGLTVIEANACGTPVVATARGSIPELVRNGETGWIVGGVDDAVDAVASLGEISRARCREWVASRFTVTHMARGYLNVYDRVLAGGTAVIA